MLSLWKEGEIKAFESLYKRHFARLLRAAFSKVKNRNASEEIVQDTFFYLYQHSEKIDDRPLSYLFTVLSHKVIDFYRRKMEIETIGLNEYREDQNPFANSADERLNTVELVTTINGHIERLPEKCRAIFLLRRRDQLSNKDIAERLGISIKTVEAQMTKALKYLKQHLDFYPLLVVLFEMEIFK